ncbi:MAG: complex I subunit 5 family protein [Micrococcus sp.]|nr:complex I subunit 5 family protein [Micrococcus sp.]
MLLLFSLMLPLLTAGVLMAAPLAGSQRADTVRRSVTLVAPLSLLPAVVSAVVGGAERVSVPWLLFGAEFTLDTLARSLMVVTAVLYAAALAAPTWVARQDTEPKSPALAGFLLVSATGNLGVYVAADLATFYVCFATMSLAAAGLVVHYRTAADHRATGIYLVLSVLSETALLAAFLLLAGAGATTLDDAPAALLEGPHTGLILACLLIGFGIKAGTVPLHVWLPLAHPAAPPAASAVMSGAMVKAGLVGWLRFLPLGSGDATVHTAGWVLLILALLGAFAAVVAGVLQSDPKVVLAYSTISQMGFLGALVGIAMIDPDVAPAVVGACVVYAVHHALAKGALFLGVPVVKHYGRGLAGVLVLVGLAGAALAVAGAPLSSGSLGKYAAKEAVADWAWWGVSLADVLTLVATGSTLLLARFAWVMVHSERAPRSRPDGELSAWLAVCVAGITVPWAVALAWSEQPLPDFTDISVLWPAVWPLLLGIGVAGLVWWLAATGRWPQRWRADGSVIAPGDVVVAEESLVSAVRSRSGPAVQAAHEGADGVGTRVLDVAGRWGERGLRAVRGQERGLGSWTGSGTVILVILSVATVVLWLVLEVLR